jgi:hypothetical protein
MYRTRNRLVLIAGSAVLLLTAPVAAQDDIPSTRPGDRTYSPYPEQTCPNGVFFGDTHVHTGEESAELWRRVTSLHC